MITEKIICICGCSEYSEILKGYYNRRGISDYPFTLLRCKSCRLVRTFPIPEVNYESISRDTQAHLEDEKTWREISKGEIRRVKQYVKVGKLLDIGCNIGLMVKETEKRGFDAIGIDIDEKAVEIARRESCNVNIGVPESMNFLNNEFDVVLMNHVLEHILDVNCTLREVYRVLKPGGLLFLNVPNYAGLIARMMKERWLSLCPDEHVWQFEPNTLLPLLAYRFEIVNIRTSCLEPPSSPNLFRGWIKKLIIYFQLLINKCDELRIIAKKPHHGQKR
ncbi:MAG: class I SAM-dependent methyltransferase [bacterium]|nr:class I SAM-dependent methyltransferase [bacterium]